MSRPYSRNKDSEKSVTTIKGDMLSSNGLDWAAAKLTAERAIYCQDEWLPLVGQVATDSKGKQEDAAMRLLRFHFREVWDGRASMGTALHQVNDEWCHGREADLPAIVAEIAETYDGRAWRGQLEDVVNILDGYVAGLERFYADFTPTTIDSEYIVREPGLYIGTADWCAELHHAAISTLGLEGPLVLDIKTTNQQEPGKGIYHEDWALQTAAYRWAREIVEFVPEGPKGKLVPGPVTPNHETVGAGIIHLRGDGRYSFYVVDASEEMRDAFVHMAQARATLKALPKVPVSIEGAP